MLNACLDALVRSGDGVPFALGEAAFVLKLTQPGESRRSGRSGLSAAGTARAAEAYFGGKNGVQCRQCPL